MGFIAVSVDHNLSAKDYKDCLNEYGSIIDAIADGKFGYSQEYEELLRKYGRTYKGDKTNKRSDRSESNKFMNEDEWIYDFINESTYNQDETSEDYIYDEKPKSFKEKVQEAEFVEAEVIEL